MAGENENARSEAMPSSLLNDLLASKTKSSCNYGVPLESPFSVSEVTTRQWSPGPQKHYETIAFLTVVTEMKPPIFNTNLSILLEQIKI